jgi:long-chain acyl-CoA synthetase
MTGTTSGTTSEAADAVGFWVRAPHERDRVAFIEPGTGSITAGEAYDEVNRISHGLRALGLGTGSHVAVLMANSTNLWLTYLATMQVGMYFTPINFHFTAPEVEYILRDAESDVLVVSEEFADVAGRAAEAAGIAPDRRFVVGTAPGFRPLGDLTDGQPTTLPDDRLGGQLMQYTSGTTGRPKGVKRPIGSVDADTAATALRWIFDSFGMTPGGDEVWLVAAPMYHTANIGNGSIAVHFGYPVVTMSKWDPEEFLAIVQEHRVSCTHMVPTQFVRLLKLPDEVRARYDVSSLRHIIHGAAPCSVEVKQKTMEWLGPVLYEYYGATESGATFVTPEEWLRKPGTVGKPFATTVVKALDADGEEVPTGEVGLLYMKTAGYGFEYHKDPGKTERARRGDLITVGDYGYFDEDGYLFLAGRDAEVIISGGVNIYPSEAEHALIEHPSVLDVAVIGVPHDEFGEQVLALVQPMAGAEPGPELEQELIGWCRERLAHLKCPRAVEFRDDLQRDPNGKIAKHKLRAPYWEGRDRAI